MSDLDRWRDIKLVNHDIKLDNANVPEKVHNRDTIAQDIQSMLYDTGLLIEAIGQRSAEAWQLQKQRIIAEVETDTRIIPGTVLVKRTDEKTVYLTADTVVGIVNLTTSDPAPKSITLDTVNKNLFYNSDFKINQRGIGEVSTLNTYFCDLWRTGDWHNGTVKTNGNGFITLSNLTNVDGKPDRHRLYYHFDQEVINKILSQVGNQMTISLEFRNAVGIYPDKLHAAIFHSWTAAVSGSTLTVEKKGLVSVTRNINNHNQPNAGMFLAISPTRNMIVQNGSIELGNIKAVIHSDFTDYPDTTPDGNLNGCYKRLYVINETINSSSINQTLHEIHIIFPEKMEKIPSVTVTWDIHPALLTEVTDTYAKYQHTAPFSAVDGFIFDANIY